jgi:hypothetical protein
MSFMLAARMRLEVDEAVVEVRERRWGVVVALVRSGGSRSDGNGKDTGVETLPFEEVMMGCSREETHEQWACDEVGYRGKAGPHDAVTRTTTST